MIPNLPDVGKIYSPKDYPDNHFKVKEVSAMLILRAVDSEISYTVQLCAPDDPSEEVEVEVTHNEWVGHGFTLVSHSAEV